MNAYLANGNTASLIENAIGTAGDDYIWGNKGANRLVGGSGTDRIYGFDGNDLLLGGDDLDELFGGGGADRLEGEGGSDTLNGEDGDDQLFGGDSFDNLNGGAGRDILWGGASSDSIDGGDGDDLIYGEEAGDRTGLSGGAGNDAIYGGVGVDNAYGDDGDDVVETGDGEDVLSGGNGRDRLVGGSGNDLLDGGDGADTLIGGLGNDTYWYTDSADIIIELAGEGQDKIETSFSMVLPDNIEILVIHSNAAISATGNALDNTITGDSGDDIIDGGAGIDSMGGMMGNDTYHVDNIGDIVGEGVNAGTDTVYASVSFVLRRSYVIPADPNYNPYTGASVRPNVPITVAPVDIERLILVGTADIDATGNEIAQSLVGNAGRNILTGAEGNDEIDGGGNVDFAVFTGLRSGYTISQGAVGAFTIAGLDGTDTLVRVEYARFDDALVRLLPGVGTTANFNTADPATYRAAMAGIRDFDGNDLGANDGWLRIGAADVNGDGDGDEILINRQIGRFATIGTAADGRVYFSDHGWAGETRVVGTYIDPLVTSGSVAAGSANDSQRRFQNDLQIENINRVLGAGDFDHDGLQEVYFALTDGSAFLHAYMHADGNIRYANYQSEQEMIDYLNGHGWAASTYADWLQYGA